ncbi:MULTISPECIES: class I SAM-dependent methyltransferase [Burkholderia]|uniref:Methyltransferase domain-containing protein n=1 Tax=Burkholderia humptydooensis TaxID=430531 RepID=A0A7U4SU47_9BURK|nr:MULTISPECIES: class I SAM-dependent methyltransferase [Burkholderia]AJY39449.1 methyltransferase domain protein [Burkholderia sp. 2002721687]ALX44770.1 methyltransferase [Burkholderia humptydooensis]KVN06800.1 methyltransferase [Burkholderia sp. MSMB1552]KWZ49977.1 methyltransferase [Burkholderia sp. MSMB1588]QPS46218.1 methyltransferase domain-containing protein [Burkholderia humptydooensis]
MVRRKLERWSALDLAEGLQLAHAVAALQVLGVLDAMKEPVTAQTLSDGHDLDPELLRGVLEYAASRTNLVCKTDRGFTISEHYTAQARFLLNLYAGAYADNASRLATLLRRPALAGSMIDLVAHARAFDASEAGGGALAAIVSQLRLNHVLDLGCGAGALLRELAAGDCEFVGWGLDRNPSMCRAARVRARQAGLATRVKVFHGDGRNPGASIPPRVVARVQNVVASQFVNEMFRGGTSRVETWLRRMRRLLPGRMLVISDYYGRLGHGFRTMHRETLLHDYVQLISGQGVPPPDSDAWLAVYRAAGCRPLHVIEDRTATTRFVHLVGL